MNRGKAVVLALATAGLLFLSILSSVLFPVLDQTFYDLDFTFRTLGIESGLVRAQTPSDVVIVGIDPESIARIGGFPWPRATFADLVNKVNKCKPAAIGIDVMFPHRQNQSDGDKLLAEAFARVPRLVLPFRATSITSRDQSIDAFDQGSYRHRFQIVKGLDQLEDAPFYVTTGFNASDERFAQHALRGGFLNVASDRASQKLRQVIHVMRLGEEYYPSFAVASVAAYLGLGPADLQLRAPHSIVFGDRVFPLSGYTGSAQLNFRGPSGTIPTVSAADVLNGTVDPSFLQGKLVFIGITDQGEGADFFSTPVQSQFPGVEVWATAAADILEGTWVRKGSGILVLLRILLLLLIFPGLVILIPSQRKGLTFVLATSVAMCSAVAGILLFATTSMFWNPAPHVWAWAFSLIWVMALRVDPTIVEKSSVDLEPSADEDLDVLPPATERDFIQSIPDTDTAKAAARQLAEGLGKQNQFPPTAHEQRAILLPKLRSLAGGEIVKVLGSGGMADVYLIWQPRLEVYRAVKVIKAGQSQRFLDRFETEIRIFASLNHGNIVQCYNAGEWFGLPYLEMEFVPGISMDDMLQQGITLSPFEAAAVGVLICRALHYAHRQVITVYGKTYKGVVHRDLKPANVMFSRSGRVKLTDFGIARPGSVSIHTGEGGRIVGTLPYLAPEQLGGEEITPRTDIYALGATLYELLVGRRAFPQTDAGVLLNAKNRGDYPSLKASSKVPDQLASIIDKAMALEPVDRYESAAAMSVALSGILSEASTVASFPACLCDRIGTTLPS